MEASRPSGLKKEGFESYAWPWGILRIEGWFRLESSCGSLGASHPEQGAQPHVQAAAGDLQGGAPQPLSGKNENGIGNVFSGNICFLWPWCLSRFCPSWVAAYTL